MTETSGIPQDERDVDADHLVETPETLRDSDPEAPAMDRGIEASDRPLGAEKHGTTHEEAAEGESLDERLAEEVPDVGAHDPIDDVVADHPETFARDGADVELTEDDELADAYGDGAGDLDDLDDLDDPVGRLVEPDEGVRTDTEKDAVALGVGADGGGLSAEETAMHLEEDR